MVVPRQVISDRLPCLADGLIGLQIYLFVLHAASQPFDKNVVPPASLAIHRQSDSAREDRVGEDRTGELTPLDALLKVKGQFEPVRSGGCAAGLRNRPPAQYSA
jgi:hypothetical protein